MDEKVDVYADNAKWSQLLQDYNKIEDKSTDEANALLKDMWPIMYRCASNILKRRFGKFWSWEKISDVAIDMCEVILNRITNKTGRYPNGYDKGNLPTVMGYAMLNVVYGPQARKEDLENSHANYDDFANMSLEDLENFNEYIYIKEDDTADNFSDEQPINIYD